MIYKKSKKTWQIPVVTDICQYTGGIKGGSRPNEGPLGTTQNDLFHANYDVVGSAMFHRIYWNKVVTKHWPGIGVHASGLEDKKGIRWYITTGPADPS